MLRSVCAAAPSRPPESTVSRVAPVAFVLLATLTLMGTASAQDQPAGEAFWPQFQGTATHAGVGEGPLPPYRQAWTFRIRPSGEVGASAPVIAGGLAVTVGPHAVYGVDLATGEQRWSIARTEGPSTAPAVADVGGRQVLVYLEGGGDGGSSLVAVDLASQKPVWDHPFALAGASRSGVTVDGGTAFVGDDDGEIYAIDLATGKAGWRSATGAGIEGPPAVAGGIVYAVSQDLGRSALSPTASGASPTESPTPSPTATASPSQVPAKIVALDERTGKQAWSPFQSRLTSPYASIPLATDAFVVASFLDGTLYQVSATTGLPRWDARVIAGLAPTSSPALAGNGLFVADTRAGLIRLDPASGDPIWDFQLNDKVIRSSPVVIGNRYALLGLDDGRLTAVNTATGRLVWEAGTGVGLVGAIAVSPDLVVAAKGGKHGGLVAFAHDPSGKLTDIPSPTSPDPARLIGWFLVAFLVVGVALYLGMRVVAARLGPAFPIDEEEDEDGAGGDEDEP